MVDRYHPVAAYQLCAAAGPPYPPRTLIEVQRLFGGMIMEIDSVFYAPAKR